MSGEHYPRSFDAELDNLSTEEVVGSIFLRELATGKTVGEIVSEFESAVAHIKKRFSEDYSIRRD